MANENIFDYITQDMVDRINSDEYFTDIAAFHWHKGDISAEVQRAIGTVAAKSGKSGICAVVMPPMMDDDYGNVTVPALAPKYTVRILENPVINDGASGTQKSALAVAARIAAIFKLYQGQGKHSCFRPGKPFVVPVKDEVAPVAYDVVFSTQEQMLTMAKVVPPTILPAGGAVIPTSVTMGCATFGASIYYTTDGTYPGSGNTAATLYTGAISWTTAAVVRIGAAKTGYIASDTIEVTFTLTPTP
jgi:hypothetical protein